VQFIARWQMRTQAASVHNTQLLRVGTVAHSIFFAAVFLSLFA
jgi:hypothetical protein